VRVLVIVHEPKERMRATTALELQDGIEVVEASSPKEARRILREAEPFDVLVVDGDIQPQGGFSFLYELRAQDALADRQTPPALVLIAREQDRFLTDWAGGNELLLKPVDPFEVLRRVRGLAGADPAPRDPGDESGEQVPGDPGAPAKVESNEAIGGGGAAT
jgi:DNA-binding response OmpR family regulator